MGRGGVTSRPPSLPELPGSLVSPKTPRDTGNPAQGGLTARRPSAQPGVPHPDCARVAPQARNDLGPGVEGSRRMAPTYSQASRGCSGYSTSGPARERHVATGHAVRAPPADSGRSYAARRLPRGPKVWPPDLGVPLGCEVQSGLLTEQPGLPSALSGVHTEQ